MDVSQDHARNVVAGSIPDTSKKVVDNRSGFEDGIKSLVWQKRVKDLSRSCHPGQSKMSGQFPHSFKRDNTFLRHSF